MPRVDAETPASPVLAPVEIVRVAPSTKAPVEPSLVGPNTEPPSDDARTWTARDWIAFISALPWVKSAPNGHRRSFFIVTDDQMPFATVEALQGSDTAFRLSIGVGRTMFDVLCPAGAASVARDGDINVFMPDPRHARHGYVCIISPAEENAERAKHLVRAAHTEQMRNRGYVANGRVRVRVRDAGVQEGATPKKRKRGRPRKPQPT